MGREHDRSQRDGGKGRHQRGCHSETPSQQHCSTARTQENAIGRVGCGHPVEPMVLAGMSATEAEFSGTLWHEEEAVQDQGPGSWKGAPGMR